MNSFLENIEPYLDGELSSNDVKTFEDALRADENLRDALALEQATRATMYLMMRDKVKKKIIKPKPTLNIVWKKWAIAASIVGITLISILYFFTQKPDNQLLTAKYTYDFPLPKVQGNPSGQEELAKFFTLIDAKKYNEAEAEFSSLSAIQQQNESNIFFLAYVQLKNKQYKTALISFEKLKNLKGEYPEAIKWYKIIAKLGNGQDVKSELIAIQKDMGSSYKTKADALLEELY